jgi:hypothetical protein
MFRSYLIYIGSAFRWWKHSSLKKTNNRQFGFKKYGQLKNSFLKILQL